MQPRNLGGGGSLRVTAPPPPPFKGRKGERERLRKAGTNRAMLRNFYFMQFSQILVFSAKEAGLRFSFVGWEVAATRRLGWGPCVLCYCSLS